VPDERVTIRQLAGHVGETVTLRGWVSHSRSKGKIAFLVLRDGTGRCQAVASVQDLDEATFESLQRVGHESTVEVRGSVREDARAPGGYEIGIQSFGVLHPTEDYPIGRKEHGVEFLLDHRHLYLRHRVPWATLRVRDEVVKSIRDFMYDNDFVLIDSPILTPAACEGTSTLFETDYFGDSAYLSQSGQLYLEPACQAFDKVYCFGPTFRAEKSKTRRHLTEFWMIEPEMAWADLDDVMGLAERLIAHIVDRVLDRRRDELAVLERDVGALEAISTPFPRLSYAEAAEILTRQENVERAAEAGAPPFEPGNDLGAMDETILGGLNASPLMVHRYPAEVKAFYMEPDPEDPSKALCVDVLAPDGYGEIIGGSVRIHDLALLRERIRAHELPEEAFRWYLDVRRYGSVPHGGFGMGIERVVAWLCGVHHLRETIPYPRTIQRLYP
jgi:asparaginyl-tRNA synthetase